MDGYEKTPTLGLNKPKKGDFDWDLPLNENWDILDRVGGAQLPLLATIDLDYKLSGDAAIGWALEGSTLSGNTYTSLWNAMKAAYDRSVAANETHYNKTYSVRTDAVTGWRFVTMDVYRGASSAMGDSLGHVLDTNAKTIRLRTSWYSYDLPMQDTRYIGNIWDETLPNIKGELASIGNTRGNVNSSTEAIYITANFRGRYGGGGGRAEGEESNILFNANRSNHAHLGVSPYRDNARVCPQSKNLLRYYKVGNTIINVENIDVGNVLNEMQALSVNSANVSLSNIDATGKANTILWGTPNYAAGISGILPYTAPKAGLLYLSLITGEDSTTRYIQVNGKDIGFVMGRTSRSSGDSNCYIPLTKGDVVTNFNDCGVHRCIFYPFKGA